MQTSRDLLVLSASLISGELQEYFGKLPSAMVPFQMMPALEYIYHENINHYDNIYIVVRDEYQFIDEFLMHTRYKVKTILLPHLGDLAYSLEYGLEQITSSHVTVLFGDTYIPYMTSHFKEKDVLMYGITQDSERWTVIEKNRDNQLSFIDKKYIKEQDNYQIVIGAFNILDPKNLLQLFKNLPTSEGNRFYDVMELYFNSKPTEIVYAPNWKDYGHEDKYFEEKRRVASRAFNHIHIDTELNIVEKRSKHTKKFIDEIKWFLDMPKELSNYLPKIHDYSLEQESPYVKMDFCDFLTLHEIFIHGNHTIDRWRRILTELKNLNNKLKVYTIDSKESNQAYLYKIYVQKTLARIQTFKEQQLIDATLPLLINGQEYLSLDNYCKFIGDLVEKEGLLIDRPFSIIHGDFCFANLLYDIEENQVYLIDPRGSFGSDGIYGDNLYEWAKLAHSIDGGYDLIISDRFNIVNIDNNINYLLHKHTIHDKVKTLFYSEIIPKQEERKIKLIQALLFLGMLPLHNDIPRRQYVMLCRAIELLDPFIRDHY